MARITTYLSRLMLNVSGLNYPMKRHCLANWIKKEDPVVYRRPISLTETNWLRVRGWKKIYQANGTPKQARVAILMTDKVDFKLTLNKMKDSSY
jgi:hypothetical protein